MQLVAKTRLSHRRNNAKLLQHTQIIEIRPRLHNLAARKVINRDPRNAHRLVRSWHAKQTPAVSALRPPAYHHTIPLGNLILNANPYIGKRREVKRGELFSPFWPMRQPRRAATLLFQKFFIGHFQPYLSIPVVKAKNSICITVPCNSSNESIKKSIS